MLGRGVFRELLLGAPALVAVQHGDRLQVQLMRLFGRKSMDPDELGGLGQPQAAPALELWLRAKAEEATRSGQRVIGVEEPVHLEWNDGHTGAETRYLTYLCGPLPGREAVAEGAATFAIDVTASVRAQGNSAPDREWLEAALDAIGTPIVLAEPDTERIWYVNKSARKLSGPERKLLGGLAEGTLFTKAIGLDAGFYCTDPSGAPIPVDQLPGARASRGEVVDAMELSWNTPYGVFALLCFAERVPAWETLPPLLVLSFFDVTHLRQVERRLSGLIEGRDEFLALAGHELRTPLTALKLHTQSLLYKYPEVCGLQAIERQTLRMEGLVEDMLACADMLERGIRLEPEELDLCAIIEGVIKRLDDDAKRARCSIARVGAQDLRGRWDRSRLEQVLVSLIRNAIRFGAGKPVRIECCDLAERVSVAVVDHGIGIDPAKQELIFERFGRSTSPRPFAGLGVGLWMVREIVGKMRGSIRVKGALGQGATFTVELPKQP